MTTKTIFSVWTVLAFPRSSGGYPHGILIDRFVRISFTYSAIS